MNTLEIKLTLVRMSELLHLGGYPDWSTSLKSLSDRAENKPDETCATVVGMFGGMGSLNDLVLYKGSLPLRQENEELDTLRAKLYSLCKS